MESQAAAELSTAPPATIATIADPGRQRMRRQWLGYGLATLLVWLIFGIEILDLRDKVGEQESARLLTQARVIETNLSHQLAATDKLLRRLVGEWESAGRPFQQRRVLDASRFQDFCDAMPGVRTLSVLDAQGDVLISNRAEFIGRNFSHRTYFTTAQQAEGNRLLVSPPFQTVVNAFVINIARVIRQADGSFGGVVTASLDPAYFEVLLNSVNYAPEMWSAIAHGDGQLFLRAPARAELVGMALAQPGSFLSRHRDSGRRESLLTGSVVDSGEQRLMALITLQPEPLGMDKPLVIEVSRRLDAVYGAWRQESLLEAVFLLLFSLAAAGGLWWFQRRQQQTEDNFRLVVQGAPYGIALLDREGNLTCNNPAFGRLLGYTMADVPNTARWLERAYPDPVYRAEVVGGWRDALAAASPGSPITRTYRVRRADGADRDIQFIVSPLPDGRRLISFEDVSAHLTDLAERQKAEDALLAREKLLSNIFDTASVAIFLLDRQGVVTHANQRMAEMFGCPMEQLIGSEYVAHVHPAERDSSRRKLVALLSSSIPLVDLERRYWRQDGSEFWGHLSGRCFQGAHGEELGLIGVIADIDLRKRAAERHSRVIETSMDGFIVVGADTRLTECNDSICQMTGYSRHEFLALSIGDLEANKSPEEIAGHIAAITRNGFDRFETVWRCKDGSELEVEVTASHLALGQENCGFVRDISRLKQHQRELDYIAHYDALTGVPNRTLLADRMHQGVAQTQRAGTLMAFCYLDLDGFKPINDQYGHAAGDRVLVEVAARLKNVLRGGDTVARMGGDEFVLLLLGLEKVEECEAAMARILNAVAAPMALAAEEQAVTISASLGVAIFPRDDADVDTLLRHADQSMYLAKQSGKNRYHLFDPDHDRVARDRSERLAGIRTAIDRQEFVFFYQPQVNMRRGVVQGVEALIRWQHPQRGLLPPADFLSVIEDSDLIVELGDWGIATALKQIDDWRRAGVDLGIGVNIAPRHLLREDFVDRLKAHLAAHPAVDPRQLDLEVLETAALEDIAHVSRVIRDCRALGVSFSLDDFGTGYSSLTYLKSLPAETLKIDQTFVRDMLADSDDRAIVQGVIGLAKVFQRAVIAEGVETIEHGSLLLGLGCELAQGYGIARPMPVADVANWVAGWKPDAAWQGIPALAPAESVAVSGRGVVH